MSKYRIKYIHGEYIPQAKFIIWLNIIGTFPRMHLSFFNEKEYPSIGTAKKALDLYKDQINNTPEYTYYE